MEGASCGPLLTCGADELNRYSVVEGEGLFLHFSKGSVK